MQKTVSNSEVTDQVVVPKVRKPRFDFSDLTNHWMGNNPLLTHFFNAFQTLFPDGERFFIRSVNRYMSEIDDPVLKERVKNFIGQEGLHGSAHQKVWDALTRHGYNVQAMADFLNRRLWQNDEGLSLESLLANIIPGEQTGDQMRLSITIALEHFTAIMGAAHLGMPERTLPGTHSAMAELADWHSAEELEHKSVAFDVYKEVAGNNYPIRIAGFALACFFLPIFIGGGMIFFVVQDKEFWQSLDVEKIVQFLGLTAGLTATVMRELPPYLRPDFHPDQVDNYALAQEILDKYALTA